MVSNMYEQLNSKTPDEGTITFGGILMFTHVVICIAARKRLFAFEAIYNFSMRAIWCGRRADDVFVERAAQKTLQTRVSLFRGVCETLSMYIFFAVAQAVFKASIGTGERWFSMGHDIFFQTTFVLVLVGIAWPCTITGRTLDVWCAALMLLGILFESPISNRRPVMPVVHSSLVLYRALLAYICPREIVGVVLNLVALMSHLAHLLFIDRPLKGPAGYSISDELFASVLETAILLAIVALVRSNLSEEAQLAITMEASRNELGAASALLHAMCDAVLELDADLRIVSHVPKLADLLLHGPRRIIQGRHFGSFFQSCEDRSRFVSNMRIPNDHVGHVADAAHYTLRDAINNKVEVEILHVGYQDIGESGRYVVGIREHHDGETWAPGRPVPSPPHRETIGYVHDASFCVRMCALSLKILRCSDAFSRLFGQPPPGMIADKVLVRSSRAQFRARLRCVMKQFFSTSATHLSADLGTLDFHTQFLTATSKNRLTAQCIMILRRGESSMDEAALSVTSACVSRDDEHPTIMADLELSGIAFWKGNCPEIEKFSEVLWDPGRQDGSSRDNRETRHRDHGAAGEVGFDLDMEGIDVSVQQETDFSPERTQSPASPGTRELKIANRSGVSGDLSDVPYPNSCEVEKESLAGGGKGHEPQIPDDDVDLADSTDINPTDGPCYGRRSMWV